MSDLYELDLTTIQITNMYVAIELMTMIKVLENTKHSIFSLYIDICMCKYKCISKYQVFSHG